MTETSIRCPTCGELNEAGRATCWVCHRSFGDKESLGRRPDARAREEIRSRVTADPISVGVSHGRAATGFLKTLALLGATGAAMLTGFLLLISVTCGGATNPFSLFLVCIEAGCLILMVIILKA